MTRKSKCQKIKRQSITSSPEKNNGDVKGTKQKLKRFSIRTYSNDQNKVSENLKIKQARKEKPQLIEKRVRGRYLIQKPREPVGYKAKDRNRKAWRLAHDILKKRGKRASAQLGSLKETYISE